MERCNSLHKVTRLRHPQLWDNGRNNYCFAGKEDELVVAASADHGLCVWSLPSDQQVAGDPS